MTIAELSPLELYSVVLFAVLLGVILPLFIWRGRKESWHDLKGTFVTQARRNGSSIESIAETTGNSVKDTKSI